MYEQWKYRRAEYMIFERILAYIHRHYRRSNLQVHDIAKDIHFSTGYLSLIFRRRMNQTLWEYITELRIELAKHLLCTTSKKRDEIAYEIGYESPEHFSRMFKRYTGLSPTEYRNHMYNVYL
ncbi:helix-turn-helix domain-containing protein [Paenibacillus hunanensis]|uniref:helix-turn-helix domain-containing protein n=1 Tax=Paenibacillus hunanensis TaxID=539262 RepID=UPI002A6A8711|nr:helix-turn-helix domain-containing protein [Paenibacillus hunanensis]WPP40508.1 helix-turn-helix domain-containing protein [Paenibacillus hunanensis]